MKREARTGFGPAAGYLLAVALATAACADYVVEGDTLDLPQSAEAIQPLGVGDRIPEVEVVTLSGESVKLHEIVGSQPTVIIFYRGGWCPYCNKHLAAIRDVEQQLREMGYQILAISADSPASISASAVVDDAYRLLSDSKVAAAQAFGIAFRVDDELYKKYMGYGINLEEASGETHHALPVPAAFVVAPGGVIKFAYVNPDYKVRIDPAQLVEAARAALEEE